MMRSRAASVLFFLAACASSPRHPDGLSKPPRPAVATASPVALTIAWAANGVLLVGKALSLDVASGRFTDLRTTGRKIVGPQLHLSAQPPIRNTIVDSASGRTAWVEPGRVCVRERDADGYDCFVVPAEPGLRAQSAEPRLRAALLPQQEIFWLSGEPPRCQRWSLSIAGEGFMLALQSGEATVRYTLNLRGQNIAISGPATETRGSIAAEGCLDSLPVGAIDGDSVAIGSGRWFFNEAACRAAEAAQLEQAFTLACH